MLQWRTYSYWENHKPNRELGDLLGRWKQKGMWPVSQTRAFIMHSVPSGGQTQDWRKGGLIGPSPCDLCLHYTRLSRDGGAFLGVRTFVQVV